MARLASTRDRIPRAALRRRGGLFYWSRGRLIDDQAAGEKGEAERNRIQVISERIGERANRLEDKYHDRNEGEELATGQGAHAGNLLRAS